jgi:hypothetical protein
MSRTSGVKLKHSNGNYGKRKIIIKSREASAFVFNEFYPSLHTKESFFDNCERGKDLKNFLLPSPSLYTRHKQTYLFSHLL